MISGWKMLSLGGLLFVGLAISLVIAQNDPTNANSTITEAGTNTTVGNNTTVGTNTTAPAGAPSEGQATAPATEPTEDTAGKNVDYCDPSLCNKGQLHIACNASTELYYKCSLDAEVIPMTDPLKTYITHQINKMRNKVAKGGFNGLGPAARMGTLTWDPELAHLAEYNVRKCFLQHDECRNTKNYENVGQLVGYRGLKGNLPILEDILKDIGKAWLRTSHTSSILDVVKNKDLDEKGGPPKYNFLQMVLEDAKKLGCAILQQVRYGWFQTFFTCNFEHAPIEGAPIYETGNVPATSCKSGPHKTFKNLCSEAESYSRAAPRSGFKYLSGPQEGNINGSSGTVNEQPLANGTIATEAVLPKMQRTSDRAPEQPVSNGNKTSGVEVPSDAEKAPVNPKLRRTSDKAPEQPVLNGNKTSGVEVPSDATKAPVKPKLRRTSDKAPEQPVSNGNRAPGKLPPQKKGDIGIHRRSGVQPRSDEGNKTETEGGANVTQTETGVNKTAEAGGPPVAPPGGAGAAEGNNTAGATGTETSTSAPGNNTDFYDLVEEYKPLMKKKQLKIKFARFLRLMKTAALLSKNRHIVIMTSNHEVTDSSQMKGKEPQEPGMEPGMQPGMEPAMQPKLERQQPGTESSFDGQIIRRSGIMPRSRKRSGIRPRSMRHSSRQRVRSAPSRWARTSFRAPQWIAVD